MWPNWVLNCWALLVHNSDSGQRLACFELNGWCQHVHSTSISKTYELFWSFSCDCCVLSNSYQSVFDHHSCTAHNFDRQNNYFIQWNSCNLSFCTSYWYSCHSCRHSWIMWTSELFNCWSKSTSIRLYCCSCHERILNELDSLNAIR